MTLSNHQVLDVTKRISRANEVSELSDIKFGLSLASELITDEGDRAKILAAMKIASCIAAEVQRKQDAGLLARTIEALALYDEHDEKLACLKRMGWILDDAIEAGIIEDTTSVEAAMIRMRRPAKSSRKSPSAQMSCPT
ncbi:MULTISPECIES: hypothetical protein [unclassified Sulfitobacter]|jgi:hypothetical protein|uniref:hypothetical protein n=1 Tax=unclassified Sulfitobacter TaxID=196795 RepID=UPI0004E2C814|nr:MULTISPECIES: hypothetical protein [unclassified Sulfitobacter]PTA98882.1 hypothetical protein C8254_10445 [Sulfitobacter sp. CB-A]ULO19000.1 hypothetical protein IV89_001992 [Sulfitobacter sp. CB2047]